LKIEIEGKSMKSDYGSQVISVKSIIIPII